MRANPLWDTQPVVWLMQFALSGRVRPRHRGNRGRRCDVGCVWDEAPHQGRASTPVPATALGPPSRRAAQSSGRRIGALGRRRGGARRLLARASCLHGTAREQGSLPNACAFGCGAKDSLRHCVGCPAVFAAVSTGGEVATEVFGLLGPALAQWRAVAGVQ